MGSAPQPDERRNYTIGAGGIGTKDGGDAVMAPRGVIGPVRWSALPPSAGEDATVRWSAPCPTLLLLSLSSLFRTLSNKDYLWMLRTCVIGSSSG